MFKEIMSSKVRDHIASKKVFCVRSPPKANLPFSSSMVVSEGKGVRGYSRILYHHCAHLLFCPLSHHAICYLWQDVATHREDDKGDSVNKSNAPAGTEGILRQIKTCKR